MIFSEFNLLIIQFKCVAMHLNEFVLQINGDLRLCEFIRV